MRNYFIRFTFLTLFLFLLANFSLPQSKNFPTPREEKLLNGLNVLIWRQANTGRVSVKLRIHSGSAFDPKDREGTMALLSDIFFPDTALKNYFKEDLQGKLEVISTYDYIQINAEAKSDEFVNVMETVSSAILQTQIDTKTLTKVKDARMAMVEKLEKDPNYIADRAVAERLYGDFPYGRAKDGTTESLKKVDFADLIFSRQRFVTADNATLTITGDVKTSFAYRAARRLFGGWQKSLKKIPSNFRVPEAPETTPLTLNVDTPNVNVHRFAFDTISKKDKDYFASEILVQILNERVKKSSNEVFVKNNANYLRGNMLFGFNGEESESVQPSNMLISEKITENEYNSAKSKVLAKLNNTNIEDLWFYVHTYKLESVLSEMKKAENVTLADVKRVAGKIAKNQIVKVSVVSVEKEKTEEKKPEGIPNKRQEEDPQDPHK